MKILFLAPSITINGHFGDSVRIRELISNLSKTNEVIALVQAEQSESIPVIRSSKIEIVKVLRSHRLISSSFNSFFSSIKMLSNHNPEIVYETAGGLFGIGCISKKLFNTPVIVDFHGFIIDELRMMNENKYYRVLIRPILDKIVLSSSDRIITVTPGLKKRFCQFYNIREEKVRVVPNGVNTELFKPIDQNKARYDLNLEEESYYIGFVGNLAPWQGVECLVKAAPLILREIREARFLIVGDGDLKMRLIEMVKDLGLSNKFVFTGKVKYEEVPKYINSCDVCVAPFKKSIKLLYGASPLKIYEYLACGKAVVASNMIDIKNLLEQINAGVVISPEDIHELAYAIVRLLDDKKLREKMGMNGRHMVVKNYSWARIAEKVEEICKELIEERIKI
ncbi:MAG: glycosyltransferase family 4 protein [Nitrososphaerales archaeon]